MTVSSKLTDKFGGATSFLRAPGQGDHPYWQALRERLEQELSQEENRHPGARNSPIVARPELSFRSMVCFFNIALYALKSVHCTRLLNT